MGLAAVVITLNEEHNIERCLQSLSFADEVAVLDSFSSDSTLDIARRFTDNVAQKQFAGFSEQWNAALGMVDEEWVMIVAADEVVTEPLAAEIGAAISRGDCDGWRMPRLTYFLGKAIRRCGWYPDYQLRVARASKARIPDRLVHERLEVDGTVGTLKHDLLHYSYPTITDYVRKMVAYSRAAARQKFDEGRRFRITDLLLSPALAFGKMYLLKQGFRDGAHGLVLSVLGGCSIALRYAMLMEMSLREGHPEEP